MNLNKADVERIVEGVLEKLTFEVTGESHWTNDRTLILKLGDRELTRIEFSVESMKDDGHYY